MLTRIRTKDERQPTTWSLKGAFGNAPYSSPVVYPAGYAGSTSTMSDNLSPGFRKVQKAGGIVLNDCVLTRSSRVVVNGTAVVGPLTGYHEVWTGDLIGLVNAILPTSTHLIDLGNMSDNSLIRAYAKVNEAPLMSGELLSDFSETMGMLRRPFSSATQLLGRMLKRRSQHLGKTTNSAAKATANAWLEYRYGWKPIFLDATTVIKELHKVRARVNQLRLVSRAGISDKQKLQSNWDDGKAGNAWSSAGETYVDSTVSASAGVIYDVVCRTSTEHVLQVAGARARDIPATIWEIIPYSFVVDWFLGIGPWLQAVVPDPAVEFRGNWVSTVKNSVSFKTVRYSTDAAMPAGCSTGSFGSETVTSSNFCRTCNQSLPPLPVWTGKILSILHQADALALLTKPILGSLTRMRH